VTRAPTAALEPAAAHPGRLWLPYLLLVVCFVIWSNSFSAARALVGDDVPAAERLDPREFVVVRFAPVALCCLAWFAALPRARREARAVLAAHPALVPVLGLAAVWAYNLAFGAGQERVSAGAGSLITTVNPVLTYLLALALGQERTAAAKLAGLALAMAGVYVVVVHGAGRAVEVADLRAAALLLLAPASWAIYTVLSKPLLTGRSPLTLTFLVLGLASLPTLPALALDAELLAKLGRWGAPRFGAALFLALACTVVGFWLWYEALARLSSSSTAAFVFLNPPLALFFEWIWFDRLPAPGLLLGGSAVLAGVYLCLRRPTPRTGPAPGAPA
jgi:drug/metabolite transporter (DMT)-like permease